MGLVENLVKSHRAHTEGRGRGSECTVHRPLLSNNPLPANAPDSDGSHPKTHCRARILVIDDNPDAAQSLSTLLEMLGHETRTAHCGQSGLEIAEAFSPHRIIIDIGMPGMDGYEVCRRLRERDPKERTIYVALTGFGEEEDRERSRAAGFDHHMVKPVNLAALRDILSGVLP